MKKQYFYKNNECKANHFDDDNCICWYDEGTGPLPDAKGEVISTILWRHEPEEVVFTVDMIDAIYAAWHDAGVDVAGGNWERFVGMLPTK